VRPLGAGDFYGGGLAVRVEYLSNHDPELTAAGYRRVLRFGTLDIYWRTPDGRVLKESAALAELRKQRDEEEGR
jgi:hypothetical protein